MSNEKSTVGMVMGIILTVYVSFGIIMGLISAATASCMSSFMSSMTGAMNDLPAEAQKAFSDNYSSLMSISMTFTLLRLQRCVETLAKSAEVLSGQPRLLDTNQLMAIYQ